MLSNKDKIFLAGLQESLKEFVKADVGRAARADLVALEKAAGGKAKLDQAARILASANAEAENVIKQAGDSARAIVDTAQSRAAAIVDAAKDREASASRAVREADEIVAKFTKKLADVEQSENDLKDRYKAAADYSESLTARAAELDRREKEVARREDEIAKFEAWRKTAPA